MWKEELCSWENDLKQPKKGGGRDALSEKPLFIYFDKQSLALIIHDNACPGRNRPLMSQPQAGVWVSAVLILKHPVQFSYAICQAFTCGR